MLREKCRTCGSGDVYHGRVMGESGVTLISAASYFRQVNATKCLACVTCGSLEPYLDDKGREKVRDWKAKESNQLAPPGTEGVKPPSLNTLVIAIALAVAGIAAALAAFVMQTGNKINGSFGH